MGWGSADRWRTGELVTWVGDSQGQTKMFLGLVWPGPQPVLRKSKEALPLGEGGLQEVGRMLEGAFSWRLGVW